MPITKNLDPASKTLSIKVSGRFDFGLHQEFRGATDFSTSDVDSIVVDMKGVDYLDSSALGMLLVLRDKVGERQGAVSIKGAKPEVSKILEIANFDKLFTLVK